jgi:hypothetical protein
MYLYIILPTELSIYKCFCTKILVQGFSRIQYKTLAYVLAHFFAFMPSLEKE